MHREFESPVKSVGHGITCNKDVDSEEEAWLVLLALSQDIGHRLRIHDLAAGGVQLTVKDNDLEYRQCQAQLRLPTQSPLEIAHRQRSDGLIPTVVAVKKPARFLEYTEDWSVTRSYLSEESFKSLDKHAA